MYGTETRGWRLRWGPVLAGAALAASFGFVGDLAGAFLATLEPGRAGGFAWLGGLVTLAGLLVGTFAGGNVAARLAGGLDREECMLHGLLVWALVTLAAAAELALLAAGPVVISVTAGQLRLLLAGGTFGLVAAAGTSVAGALAARPELRGRPFRRRPRAAEVGAREAPGTTTYAPPSEGSGGPGGPLPPGLHR